MKHFILAILCLVALVAFTSCEKEEEFANEYKVIITSATSGSLDAYTPEHSITKVEKGKTVLTFKRTTKQAISLTFHLDNVCKDGEVTMMLYIPDNVRIVTNESFYTGAVMKIQIVGYF